MAPACYWRGAGWVLARPLRQPHAGDSTRPFTKPDRKGSFLAPDDPPPLVGVQLVRPRRYAAAGAPAGPLPHGGVTPGSCEEDPEEQSGPARRHHASHRAKTPCPLDASGPHGCRPRRGSRRWRSASSGRCCGIGPAWSGSVPSCATGSTRWPPITDMTGPPATGPGPAAAGSPTCPCPPCRGRSSLTAWRSSTRWHPRSTVSTARYAPGPRPTRGPGSSMTLPGVGQFTALQTVAEIGDITRFANARKLAPRAGLTRIRPRLGPDRPYGTSPRRSALAAVGAQPGWPTAKRSPEFAATYAAISQTAREEDRHHRDRPQAADPRLPPARRSPGCCPGTGAPRQLPAMLPPPPRPPRPGR